MDISPLITAAALHNGVNPYPGRAALMTHLLLHAAGEMVFRTLRLVQCTTSALAQRAAPWGLWWALPPLALVARYYPSVPPMALAALHDSVPAALRRLARQCVIADVSYSNLRRSALPGLDWSRSLGERLGYTLERTVLSARTLLHNTEPPREVRAQRGAATQQLPARRWHRLRPVRPATLKALQFALIGPA